MRGEFKVKGDQVVTTLKELLHEGNVRHIVIKNDEGRVLIEFPVSIGLAGALLLPVWAAVGAVAAMVTNCTIEVERKPWPFVPVITKPPRLGFFASRPPVSKSHPRGCLIPGNTPH